MSLPADPEPNPISTTVATEPAGSSSTSPLAVVALVVGILAFLSGLVPFWGVIAGGAAVVLGVIALSKRQSKGLALTGVILGAIAGLTSLITTIALIGGLVAGRESDVALTPAPTAPVVSSPTETVAAEPTPSATPTAAPSPKPPAAPAETVSQANAKRSALSYLDFAAFSRSGLIGQLEYEGFSTEDATYGVDAAGADWFEQAANSAASYLEFTSFSRSGLIEQLIYEGFSPEEAEFGVTSVGL